MLSFGSGCSTVPEAPEPIYIHTVETVIEDRYVPITGDKVKPVEIIDLPPGFLTLSDEEAVRALGFAFVDQRVRAEQCNGQLNQISQIGGTEAPKEE